MGRPIHKKYFGNTNYNADGEGVGGEKLASVTIAAPIAASLAALTTTVTFSAPQITGGQTATGTAVIDGNGDLTGINITDAGSGYTAVPTISVVDSDNNETLNLTSGSGGVTVALTTASRINALKCEAQIGSGSELTTGDVLRQVGSKRYRVRTSDGTAVCKLVQSAALGENEMSITAVDANTNAYFVRKLTSRVAVLERKVSGSGDFATGTKVKWTFGSATSDTVSIESQ
jgi:hypothetical protein